MSIRIKRIKGCVRKHIDAKYLERKKGNDKHDESDLWYGVVRRQPCNHQDEIVLTNRLIAWYMMKASYAQNAQKLIATE